MVGSENAVPSAHETGRADGNAPKTIYGVIDLFVSMIEPREERSTEEGAAMFFPTIT